MARQINVTLQVLVKEGVDTAAVVSGIADAVATRNGVLQVLNLGSSEVVEPVKKAPAEDVVVEDLAPGKKQDPYFEPIKARR